LTRIVGSFYNPTTFVHPLFLCFTEHGMSLCSYCSTVPNIF
jgi:uncharacterized Zn-finger protein